MIRIPSKGSPYGGLPTEKNVIQLSKKKKEDRR